MRAQFVISEVWIGLRRNLTMTIALIATVAIGMALFGVGLLVQQQVDATKGFWGDRVQVSVFLCTKGNEKFHDNCKNRDVPTTDDKKEIESKLKGLPQVAEVFYESQKQAWENFTARMNQDQIAAFRMEDLPDSFRVRLEDPDNWQPIAKAAQEMEGVANVRGDQETLKKFFSLLEGIQWAGWGIAIVQGLAAALLIGNTMRLAAYSRRRETGIMRLVGASNVYIQLPFLLEGMIAGLVGGTIAFILLVGAKFLLFERLQESLAITVQLSWPQILGVGVFSLVCGVLFCAIMSFVTLRRFLRV